MNNILLTGKSGCGKSYALNLIVQELLNSRLKVKGFITKEITQEGQRVGFKLERVDCIPNQKDTLISSSLIPSNVTNVTNVTDVKFKKWYIHTENLESLISDYEIEDDDILILDEIGPMQLTSIVFQNLALKWLNSKNIVIGTIKEDHDELLYSSDKQLQDLGFFIKEVKERVDTEIRYVTTDTKDEILERILF